jgi:hypothetical protein
LNKTFPDSVVNDQTENNSPLRSLPKAGARKNLSETFLRKKVHAGEGPAVVKIGTRFFVSDASMDAWIANQRTA